MTVVEKAAYLKGLTEGLGIAPDSKEGKLWNALNELLSDMAHEIEDLHACYDEHDEALDEVCDELNYLEELTCDLDFPEDDDDYDDEDDLYDAPAAKRGRYADEDEISEDDEMAERIIRWAPPITTVVCALIIAVSLIYRFVLA